MNSRLNIQDIAGLLAEQTGKGKAEIERFLRDFVAVVSEGVYTHRLVKVKGLGTFKIISVEKRESIHVNTGERFVIPAHYKFSFLPDKDLREQVNKPFSMFETTEINENVNFSGIEESVSVEEKETEDESVEEVMPDKEVPLTDGNVVDIVPEPEPEPVQELKPVQEPEPVLEPEPVQDSDSQEDEICPPVKKRRKRRIGVWILVSVCVVAGVSFFLGWHRCMLTSVSLTNVNPEKEVTMASPDTLKEISPISPSDSLTETVTASTDPVKEESSKVLDTIEIKYGDLLTVISLKYYGHKLFWVYIYQFNKAIIKDPNNIPIGTKIEIPVPEVYGIDAKSRASREKAAALQMEILTGKKDVVSNI